MMKIYILFANNNLVDLVSDILNNLNYLPIIIKNNNKLSDNLNDKSILFTDYYGLNNKNQVLIEFDKIICFLSYGLSIKDLNIDSRLVNKIYEFYKTVNLNNIKELLDK
ncbi:hypothetical protein ACFX5K_02505 [Rickettsiales bacterium LUAb2]